MSRSFVRTGLLMIVVVMAALSLNHTYDRMNGGFNRQNITPIFLPASSFPPSETVNKILDQKFTYLGKGAQIYAFLSHDGQYVLKIVKQKHYQFHFLEGMLLRLPFLDQVRESKLQKRQEKKERFLSSCLLCYEELREETALEYIHLAPTIGLHPTVQIYDKFGIVHAVSLDQIEFLVQRKADSLEERMDQLLQKQDLVGAKIAIDKVKDLLRTCEKRGIVDRDSKVLRNMGFIGEKAIFIDVGELFKSDSKDGNEKHIRVIEQRYPKFKDV